MDETGTPYHEVDLQPRQAKDLLKRSGFFWVDYPGIVRNLPVAHLSAAEVKRSNRGAIAKNEKEVSTDGKRHAIITLVSDNA